jgi:fatty acid desaturase
MTPDQSPSARRPSRFQALALLTVALVLALILAAVFFAFLVIPLALLIVVYAALIAADRVRHRGDGEDQKDAA